MRKVARLVAGCTLISGIAGLGFSGEPATPAAVPPAVKAPAPEVPIPAAPAPAVAPAAPVAPKARATFQVHQIGPRSDFEIGLPAGQIRIQTDPTGSRVRLIEPRGTMVELSRPSREAVAGATVAPEEPEPPQLKDLLMQSLFQTLATHPRVRVGKTQIHIQSAPKSAPANIPAPNIELGAPAELEEEAQSAIPLQGQPAVAREMPARVQIESKATAVEAVAVPATIETGPQVVPVHPAPRRVVKIHKFAVPVGHAEEAEAPRVARTPEQLEVRRQETLKAAFEEVRRRKQAVPLEAVPLQAAPLSLARPAVAVEAAPQAVAPAQNAVAEELSAVQNELAALTNELLLLSQKRTVRGRTLQEVVRKIGETNQRLEAVRKKLPQ